jgi:hypothetical protein
LVVTSAAAEALGDALRKRVARAMPASVLLVAARREAMDVASAGMWCVIERGEGNLGKKSGYERVGV